jgi:hypothetical protein
MIQVLMSRAIPMVVSAPALAFVMLVGHFAAGAVAGEAWNTLFQGALAMEAESDCDAATSARFRALIWFADETTQDRIRAVGARGCVELGR